MLLEFFCNDFQKNLIIKDLPFAKNNFENKRREVFFVDNKKSNMNKANQNCNKTTNKTSNKANNKADNRADNKANNKAENKETY